jgi:hypothetical protein
MYVRTAPKQSMREYKYKPQIQTPRINDDCEVGKRKDLPKEWTFGGIIENSSVGKERCKRMQTKRVFALPVQPWAGNNDR